MHVVLCLADVVKWYKVQWFGQCTSDIVPLFARMAANSPVCADGSEQMWYGRTPVCANGSKTALLARMAANRCGLGVPLFARMAANSPARANGSEQMWFGQHETLNIRCVIEASLEIANKITLMLHLLGENLMILLQNHYLNAYDWSTNSSRLIN